MFLDVLVKVQYQNEGTQDWAVWGFEGKDSVDVLKQAVLHADNLNSKSKLVKWIPKETGPAGSFDHKLDYNG